MAATLAPPPPLAASAALAPSPPAEPWLLAPWLDLWWRTQDRRGSALHTWAADGAELRLVAQRCCGLRCLRAAGGEGQRRDLVCPGRDPAALAPALAALLARDRGWDWLDLDRMAQPTAEALATALRAAGCPVETAASDLQRFVRLDRPWALVEQDMAAELKRRLPGAERALLTRGAELELSSHAADDFENCLRIEASGWKGRAGSAMLSSPSSSAEFYRALVRSLAAAGWLRLWLLRLQGEIAAFEFAVATPRGIAIVKKGYDERYKRFSPGTVLKLWVLRAAHGLGCEEADMLGADDPHKAAWTPYARQLVRVQAMSPGVRGQLLHRGRALVRAARELRAPRAGAPAPQAALSA